MEVIEMRVSSTRVKTPLICKCSSQYDDRYIEVSLLLYKYQDTLYPLTSWGVWFATFTWLIAKWVNDFIGHTHTHCRIFCHQNMLPAALSLREIHLFHCNTGVRCSRVNYLLMNLIASNYAMTEYSNISNIYSGGFSPYNNCIITGINSSS